MQADLQLTDIQEKKKVAILTVQIQKHSDLTLTFDLCDDQSNHKKKQQATKLITPRCFSILHLIGFFLATQ